MNTLKELIYQWSDTELDISSHDLDQVKMSKIINYTKYIKNIQYSNLKIDEREESNYKYYTNFGTFIKKTMGWIHCNPSKPHTVELSKETFVFFPNKDEELLNSRMGMDKFCKVLTDNYQNKYYAIIGPKGSGKTYTQNYFLNQYSRELFQKKKTWFRIDMTKILKYQKTYSKRLSLEEYLNAQIVYVFFKYKDNKYSKDIFSSIDIHLLEKKVKESYEIDNNNDFEYQYNNLKNILKTGKGKMGTNKPFKHNLTPYFAKVIIASIKEKGFSFILFVDGIDNVDYAYDKNLKIWLRELSSPDENNIKSLFKAEKIIISCRPETVYISQKIQKEKKYSWYIDNITAFKIAPISVKDIFDKFLSKILKNDLDSIPAIMLEYEKTGLDKQLLQNIDRTFIKDFYNFGLKYGGYIAKSINKTHGEDFNIKENEVLEKLYNFSLRDLISDILQTYLYIHYYRVKKNISRHSVESMIKNKSLTYNRIFSMSLRHGYLYLRQYSEFAPPFSLLHTLDVLDASPLFSSSPLEYMWLGYIFLKKIEYNPFTRNDIIEECRKVGLTDEKLIINIKNKFLEYGLITYMIPRDSTEKLLYEITDRGRFALVGLSDIDILNISAYKIYFPRKFLEYGLVTPFKKDFSDATTSLVGNVLSVLKLLQIGKKKLNTNYIHFEIFSEKIIKQLVDITKEVDVKELVDIFRNFMDLYGKESINKPVIGLENLLDMYERGQISKYEYLKRLTLLTLDDSK